MNWFNINIKQASIRYLYHGTSVNNLSSILSEGLVNYREKVYDENFENEKGLRSLESYEGTYLTENMYTAVSSANTASHKYNKSIDSIVIVVVKIEDRSPNILMDEDLIVNPFVAISKVVKGTGLYGYASWIQNGFPDIESAVDEYINIIKSRHQEFNEQFYSSLSPYIEDFIKKFVIKELSIEVDNIADILYDSRSYFDSFPFAKDLSSAQAIEDFRKSFDNFMKKAHRLTTNMEGIHTYNVRNTKNITYRGKNRIEVVSVLNRDTKDKRYVEIEVFYNNNDDALNKYVKDVEKNYGTNVVVRGANELV